MCPSFEDLTREGSSFTSGYVFVGRLRLLTRNSSLHEDGFQTACPTDLTTRRLVSFSAVIQEERAQDGCQRFLFLTCQPSCPILSPRSPWYHVKGVVQGVDAKKGRSRGLDITPKDRVCGPSPWCPNPWVTMVSSVSSGVWPSATSSVPAPS